MFAIITQAKRLYGVSKNFMLTFFNQVLQIRKHFCNKYLKSNLLSKATDDLRFIAREPNPQFLVNLHSDAVKGCDASMWVLDTQQHFLGAHCC